MNEMLTITPRDAATWSAVDHRGKLTVVTARDLLLGVYEPEKIAVRAEQMLQPGEDILTRMTEVATVLAEPEQQLGMIDVILNDQTILDRVSNQSYRIVNTDADGQDQESFDAIVYAATPGGIQLRRHVFRPEQRLMYQRHAHASHAVTIPDIGEAFTDDVFEETPEGSLVTVFSSRYKGEYVEREEDVPIGEVRLRRTHQRVIKRGNPNVMDDTFIHASTTQPRRGIISTTGVAVKGTKPAANVYKTIGESSPPRLERVDVEGGLRRVRQALRV